MYQAHLMPIVLAAAATFAVGCGRSGEYAANEPVVASYGQLTDAIASTMCSREQRCGKTDGDEDETCVARVSSDTVEAIDAEECEDGILREQLDACVARIDAMECDEDVDVEDVEPCQQQLVCPHDV
jgi:hypothetical protein